MSEVNAKNADNSIVWSPRVGSSYSNGWKQIKKYFLELLLITVIGIVIGTPFGLLRDTAGAGAAILGIFGFVYGLLIVEPVDYGVSFASLRAARRDKLV